MTNPSSMPDNRLSNQEFHIEANAPMSQSVPTPAPPAPAGAGRGFWSLVILQFQGALSDNIFRISLMLMASSILTDSSAQFGKYNALLGMLFPISYLLFSVWAGFLADRYSKRTVTLATKLAEVVLMLLAVGAFLSVGNLETATPRSLALPTVVLFLMFSQSAFFSPAKYAIIPELVPEHRLGWANGVIGLWTYLAIILGATVATGLVPLLKPNLLTGIPMLLVVLAVVGYVIGLRIARVPAANPQRPILTNPLPELRGYFGVIFKDRALTLTVLGLAYFWALGSVLLVHVLVWSRDSMGYGDQGQGAHFLLLALGIGIGSALAGALSRNRIEVGLIPVGALMMAAFAFPLALASPDNRVAMAICLALVALGGGIFSVPLNALLQQLTDPRDRGSLLAANNYVTNVAMLFATFLYWLANKAEISPNGIFVYVGFITLCGTALVLFFTPEALVRFAGYALTRTIYRIRVTGVEHIPASGPALIVSNHVSFVDALLLMAVTPRPIRFIAHESFFGKAFIGMFLRATRSIPVSASQGPRELIRSMKTAAEALRQGEIICIFIEGQITRTGMMLPFRRGYEFILKEAPAPLIPVYLYGVWGSIFSFSEGRFFWKWPRQVPYRVAVRFGAPLPHNVDPYRLRLILQELGADSAIAAKPDLPLVHHRMVASARREWRRFSMVDSVSTDPVSLGGLLWRTLVVARKLRPIWQGQERVGILLPPGIGGALVNFAAAFTGRTVINLNYTVGQDVLNSCAERTGMRTIITSLKFMERLKLECPVPAVYMEDLRTRPPLLEVIKCILAARFLPARRLEKFCGAIRHPVPDDPLTIIFSSGSTGLPKGVVLSHFNVTANLESFKQGVRFYPSDRLLGVLPFFHSFGYTVSLWGAVGIPIGAVYHYNPLDVKTIGEMCQRHKVTVIVSTATFMQHYIRRIAPEQFGGLNAVVAGAERLPESTRLRFLEKFGVDPLQGYGTTELSPVVSVNVDHYRSPGFYQVGHKPGSIGHPIPGVAVQVRDPETGEPRGVNEEGLLWVKGPNVMQGYLGMPEKTAEVLRDGWYNTGDMARIDEDGFIFITGRLSRFSKIGGEMVPHGKVEDAISEVLKLEETQVAVTGVPDEKKGEQLVVLHTLDEAQLEGVSEKLSAAGLPNLFIPRREFFFKVEALPLLGTGKLDLQGVQALARQLAAERAANGSNGDEVAANAGEKDGEAGRA